MSKPAVSVQGLWKEYRIGGQRAVGETFYDVLSGALRRPFRRGAAGGEGADGRDGPGDPPGDGAADRFWALRDVSFDIAPGEVVGIIGRNGAGKSTLLKILSRITAPTKGRIEVRGRLASLLEVGTGFHAELSGRENIYLNGAILGMTRRDIARKFDEIVAFAEVEKFIDTPVKRYSSGMYVRLAFAVAAHLDCDVLIVDEVLAVGDARFQERCLGKLRELATGGRTSLFVSHNLLSIRRLCGQAIWLSDGSVVRYDEAAYVVGSYESFGSTTSLEWRDNAARRQLDAGGARLVAIRIQAAVSGPVNTVKLDEAFAIHVEFDNHVPRAKLHASINIYDHSGVHVLNSFPLNIGQGLAQERHAGRCKVTCQFPGQLLNAGMYRLEVYLVRDQTVVVDHVETACVFDVCDVELDLAWHGKWGGVVRPILQWSGE